MAVKSRYSISIMEYKIETKVSEGMLNAIEEKLGDDIAKAAYLRQLIKDDLNIDDFGKSLKKK